MSKEDESMTMDAGDAPILELCIQITGIWNENKELRHQRDDLLAACKKSLTIINHPANEKKIWIVDIENLLEQTIAKAEK